MTITTNSGFDGRMAADVVGIAALVEAQAKSGTLRMTTWPLDIVTMGQTWRGVGALGRVGELRESDDGKAEQLDLELNIIDVGLRGFALDPNDYIDQPVSLWLVGINPSSGLIDGSPVKRFGGVMDRAQVDPTEDGAKITMECRTASYNVRTNPAALRLNDAQHKAERPGERGFEYLQSMIGQPVLWLGEWTQAWIKYRAYLKQG